jgi:glucose-6-phosphate 1-dehydrogenase
MEHSLPKKNFPTLLVLFGATGDLAIKKILPALFDLFLNKNTPPLFSVVGFSRRPFSVEEYRAFVVDVINNYKGAAVLPEDVVRFSKIFSFVSGMFDVTEDYEALGKKLGKIDDEWKTCANKLFYLAVAPEFYTTICNKLHETHLTDPCSPEEGWTRVIVEKPFGKDLKTAEELDVLLSKLFEEVHSISHRQSSILENHDFLGQ